MTTEVCYLVHFMTKYKHAGHYIGSAMVLEERLRQHAAGTSAVNLMNVIKAAGIKFVVARTWTGDRKTERALKNRGGASRICPLCSGEKTLADLIHEYPINVELMLGAPKCCYCGSQDLTPVSARRGPGQAWQRFRCASCEEEQEVCLD